MSECDWQDCKEEARWEVGFTEIIHNSFMWEGSGENEFQRFFCNEHFIELNGCGNIVVFRQIGKEEWIKFEDYDNESILKGLVKKSYKLFISKELKFKKIKN